MSACMQIDGSPDDVYDVLKYPSMCHGLLEAIVSAVAVGSRFDESA